MRNSRWLKGGVALAVLVGAPFALGADHLDAPGATADPSADITDTYGWVDNGKVVLVLDTTPLADATAKFSDKVQYVFHLESTSAFGAPGDTQDIICTFDAAQKVTCWIGAKDYVTGDASAEAGLKSASGKVTVFAGLRDDPFFFNLAGFKDTVATVDAVAGMLKFDPAGCPAVDAATSQVLATKLSTTPDMNGKPGPAVDFFAGKNVLSIVLELDASLVNSGGAYLNFWASTNKGG
jgi:hypothetical protein